jgi:hypothetical protein
VFLHRNDSTAIAELLVPSPASAKSPPAPQCVLTAYAEATERRILHGHLAQSLRLPSLPHCFGVVFLRCPPQDVPRSLARASMERPLTPPAEHCARLQIYSSYMLLLFHRLLATTSTYFSYVTVCFLLIQKCYIIATQLLHS